MKQCPECRRSYTDETLNFCLDDGANLLDAIAATDETKTAIFGASPSVGIQDEPQTALLSDPPSKAVTEHQISDTEKTAILPTGAVEETKDKNSQSLKKGWLVAAALAAVLAIGGFFGYKYLALNNSKQIESIAVMPFVNESGNADVEYLSDGMTETLIKSLSQMPNLNVKARSSVFRYKGKNTDASTIGKELNVPAILNGRVVQRGQDLILYVELVDAQTENSLWKQTYNKTMMNLVALQNDIARDVADKLKVKLSGADEQKLAKKYTENTEAYKLYLQGRFYWNKRTPKDLQKAIEYFQQSITIDPNYALAYAGLADTFSVLSPYANLSPRDLMPKAKESALKVLDLDDRLSEAHNALGLVIETYEYDFAGAEREYKRAIELNPNYATAHQYYGELLTHLGRHEESYAEFRRALKIDPLSILVNFQVGWTPVFSNRLDEAIRFDQKILEIEPNFHGAYRQMAIALFAKGDFEAALEAVQKSYSPGGYQHALSNIGVNYAALGKRQEALDIISQLIEMRSRHPVSACNIARIYDTLGAVDKAFEWLEKGFEERDGEMPFLKMQSTIGIGKFMWKSIGQDSRFQDILRRIGFPTDEGEKSKPKNEASEGVTRILNSAK